MNDVVKQLIEVVASALPLWYFCAGPKKRFNIPIPLRASDLINVIYCVQVNLIHTIYRSRKNRMN